MLAVSIGMRFNRFTVVGEGDPYVRKTGRERTYRVMCDCGEQRVVRVGYLRSGRSKSCGCYRAERNKVHRRIHGDAPKGRPSREYICWCTMVQRCENPKNAKYPLYGGRGITICARWRTSFANFLADMGRKPSPKHSIDRIDNDGNYEPGNCRWATGSQQASNQQRQRRALLKNESSSSSI